MTNFEIVTGTVTAFIEVSISAIRYSFQVKTKMKIDVEARPGRITGTTTRHRICRRDRPSSRAASSSSIGTSARKPRSSHMAKGRLNAT
jgi:hypothetical protein